ncbi:hypothetical protein [Echinicola vietnamensis]|uniref:DUF3945 domain-containing protein n=1 Tax=Echinicola vietnamensis (strain DSM 17526 / LMG 23754 / KMM 6221) TaxID=926556 RepID=L0G4P9_ECHVK|nr:hypothetical protein [Echinicola vietnamensis]AGA80298.1 hypothetical protein Echvi_4091 [Echinicola vietnamensis DSM 17526]
MDKENLEVLKERLKYAGFGEELNKELEKQMKQGKKEFQLGHSVTIEDKQVDFKLNFRKSDKMDRYFFNSFDAELHKPNGSKMSNTFYQNQHISAKEAFNLLEWRPVYKTLFNKEGERYNAWLQLDLAEKNEKGQHPMLQYHDRYGFDLEKSLKTLPIVEMEGMDQKDRLLYSLKKGNLHEVNIAGKEGSFLIAANPQYKSISVYDETGKRLNLKDLRQEIKENLEQGMGKKKDTPKQEKGKAMKV